VVLATQYVYSRNNYTSYGAVIDAGGGGVDAGGGGVVAGMGASGSSMTTSTVFFCCRAVLFPRDNKRVIT